MKPESYWLPDELAELKRLRAELNSTRPHSQDAIRIGQEIQALEDIAFRRNHQQAQPKWMRLLWEKIRWAV